MSESTNSSSTTGNEPALQDHYAPGGVCFGCGPSNPQGLHIKLREMYWERVHPHIRGVY